MMMMVMMDNHHQSKTENKSTSDDDDIDDNNDSSLAIGDNNTTTTSSTDVDNNDDADNVDETSATRSKQQPENNVDVDKDGDDNNVGKDDKISHEYCLVIEEDDESQFPADQINLDNLIGLMLMESESDDDCDETSYTVESKRLKNQKYPVPESSTDEDEDDDDEGDINTTTIFLNSVDVDTNNDVDGVGNNTNKNSMFHVDDNDNGDCNDEDDDTIMKTTTTTPFGTNKFADGDPMDQEMTPNPSSDDKKRLRLEDFMRQIITQINTSSEKIWPNLLLDFTKNFSELNMPTYVLSMNAAAAAAASSSVDNSSNIGTNNAASNNSTSGNSVPNANNNLNPNRLVSDSDQDLLMDILNIAISSLSMPQTDRRVFACQLLLNIHDCLTMDTIESKVMPLLNEIVSTETTTSVRFTICFVLSYYTRRVEFDYFKNTIFPLFEKLSKIALNCDEQQKEQQKQAEDSQQQQQQNQQNSLCTSTTICFALLDSLTSLLSYLLHFNQILMKRQQEQREKQCLNTKSKNSLQENDDKENNDDNIDEDMMFNNDDDDEEKDGDNNDKSDSTKNSINEIFEFIHKKFLPLLKLTFQSMLNYIDQYRSMSVKIEQDLFNCFLHWRDQIGTHDSISQTLFSHYQSLILFILILRDYYLQNNNFNTKNCDDDLLEKNYYQLIELIDHDQWYLNFYYQLCAFHYVLPKPPIPLIIPNTTDNDNILIDSQTKKQQQQQSNISEKPIGSDALLIDQSTNSILTKINLMDIGKNNTVAGATTVATTTNTTATTAGLISTVVDQQIPPQPPQQNFIGKYQITGDNLLKSSSTSPVLAATTTTSSLLQQHLQQQQQQQINSIANNPNSTTAVPLLGVPINVTNTEQMSTLSTLSSSGASNVIIQNNDFSIGSTQYTFSPNALNNLDIFGFYRYKTIACKIILVALVPAISDLYYITKNSNLLLAQQQRQQQQQQKKKQKFEKSRVNKNSKSDIGGGDLYFNSSKINSKKTPLSSSCSSPNTANTAIVDLWSSAFPNPATIKASINNNKDINSDKEIIFPDNNNSDILLGEEIEEEKVETSINNLKASIVQLEQEKEQIITRLIDILNTLSFDNNYEIAIKMSNIIEKLVERFTEPIRLYSLLTNIMQSQNFEVIGHTLRNFYNVFSSMLASSTKNSNTKTIIEYVIDTFLRSENYLSTKPKWRLHIQYFDVMFRLSRLIPVDIVKRLIIPRLLLRFSTTRPIPCRQAVARCLLLVYLENFAQYDFEKFCSSGCSSSSSSSSSSSTASSITFSSSPEIGEFLVSNDNKLAYLSFDLFNWLDRNLKQSNKYQDRQIYIDIISIMLRFLFRDSIEWPNQRVVPNHFMVDLQELCPCLVDTKNLLFRFSNDSFHSLKDSISSQLFAMLLIHRYRLLHLMTEMATKDRVSTIRASACTVLYSLLQCTNFWVINNLHRLPEMEHPKMDDVCLESIMDYYDSYMENFDENPCSGGVGKNQQSLYTAEQLYRRLQSENDGIVQEELNKVFLLADDFRLDFNLNYYQLRNKRKKPRKDSEQSSLSFENCQNNNNNLIVSNRSIDQIDPDFVVDSNVKELVDELLMMVENIEAEQQRPQPILAENHGDHHHNRDGEDDDEGIDLRIISPLHLRFPSSSNWDMVEFDEISNSQLSQMATTLSTDVEKIDEEIVSDNKLSNNEASSSRRGLIYISKNTTIEQQQKQQLVVDKKTSQDPTIGVPGEEQEMKGESKILAKSLDESSDNKDGSERIPRTANSLSKSPKKRKSPKHQQQQQSQHHSLSYHSPSYLRSNNNQKSSSLNSNKNNNSISSSFSSNKNSNKTIGQGSSFVVDNPISSASSSISSSGQYNVHRSLQHSHSYNSQHHQFHSHSSIQGSMISKTSNNHLKYKNTISPVTVTGKPVVITAQQQKSSTSSSSSQTAGSMTHQRIKLPNHNLQQQTATPQHHHHRTITALLPTPPITSSASSSSSASTSSSSSGSSSKVPIPSTSLVVQQQNLNPSNTATYPGYCFRIVYPAGVSAAAAAAAAIVPPIPPSPQFYPGSSPNLNPITTASQQQQQQHYPHIGIGGGGGGGAFSSNQSKLPKTISTTTTSHGYNRPIPFSVPVPVPIHHHHHHHPSSPPSNTAIHKPNKWSHIHNANHHHHHHQLYNRSMSVPPSNSPHASAVVGTISSSSSSSNSSKMKNNKKHLKTYTNSSSSSSSSSSSTKSNLIGNISIGTGSTLSNSRSSLSSNSSIVNHHHHNRHQQQQQQLHHNYHQHHLINSNTSNNNINNNNPNNNNFIRTKKFKKKSENNNNNNNVSTNTTSSTNTITNPNNNNNNNNNNDLTMEFDDNNPTMDLHPHHQANQIIKNSSPILQHQNTHHHNNPCNNNNNNDDTGADDDNLDDNINNNNNNGSK